MFLALKHQLKREDHLMTYMKITTYEKNHTFFYCCSLSYSWVSFVLKCSSLPWYSLIRAQQWTICQEPLPVLLAFYWLWLSNFLIILCFLNLIFKDLNVKVRFKKKRKKKLFTNRKVKFCSRREETSKELQKNKTMKIYKTNHKPGVISGASEDVIRSYPCC